MNIYTAPHVSGAPDWSAVPSAEIGNLLWTESCGVRAWAQMCWTEEALRLRLRAAERDIRAEERGLLGMPCRDSCLEFFFSAAEQDARYINIELNPSLCIYFGFGTGREDLMRILLPDGAKTLNAASERTPSGWDVTYEIPFQLLRLFFPDFVPHGKIRGNFYKCGDMTAQEHYLAWNRVDAERPNFHLPEYFGELIFSE